jgi:hypothetical protein
VRRQLLRRVGDAQQAAIAPADRRVHLRRARVRVRVCGCARARARARVRACGCARARACARVEGGGVAVATWAARVSCSQPTHPTVHGDSRQTELQTCPTHAQPHAHLHTHTQTHTLLLSSGLGMKA